MWWKWKQSHSQWTCNRSIISVGPTLDRLERLDSRLRPGGFSWKHLAAESALQSKGRIETWEWIVNWFIIKLFGQRVAKRIILPTLFETLLCKMNRQLRNKKNPSSPNEIWDGREWPVGGRVGPALADGAVECPIIPTWRQVYILTRKWK